MLFRSKLIKGQGPVRLMAESNFEALDINMINALDEKEELSTPIVENNFMNSSCYADIVYVLLNLNTPPGLTKTKARFLKLKAVNYCILDKCLYWKNASVLLLKCFLRMMQIRSCMSFMKENVEATSTGNQLPKKFLRAGYYWPTLFQDVHKMIISCHKCQLFEGKRKLLPLPLHPITVEAPFQ